MPGVKRVSPSTVFRPSASKRLRSMAYRRPSAYKASVSGPQAAPKARLYLSCCSAPTLCRMSRLYARPKLAIVGQKCSVAGSLSVSHQAKAGIRPSELW